MVETDKGITGFGYGGPGAAFVVERHLPKLLVGEDPFQVERLWDIMWRGTLYYGQERRRRPRDQRRRQRPVGHRRQGAQHARLSSSSAEAAGERVPCYCTGNNIEQAVEFGFKKLKLAIPHGPADGEAGIGEERATGAAGATAPGPGRRDHARLLDGLHGGVHRGAGRAARAVPRLLDGGMPDARRLRGHGPLEREDPVDADGHRRA